MTALSYSWTTWQQTQNKIGRWYKVKIYLLVVVVVLKIKTLRQVQSEKGRKRRMRDREREARTKPKMPLPSSSSSTSSLIDNPFLTSSSLRSRFSSGWKLWSAQDKWRLAETNGGYNVSGRYSYVNGEPVLLSNISYLPNPHVSHSLLRPGILILESKSTIFSLVLTRGTFEAMFCSWTPCTWTVPPSTSDWQSPIPCWPSLFINWLILSVGNMIPLFHRLPSPT